MPITGPNIPTTHATRHQAGGDDELLLSTAQVSGLGNAATRNVGTTAGTVAAGDDARFLSSSTPVAETPGGTINGSNAVFTLANTPANTAGVIVVLNGVVQRNGADYSVAGTTVTFAQAPAAQSEIFAYYNLTGAASSSTTVVPVTSSATLTGTGPVIARVSSMAADVTVTLPAAGTAGQRVDVQDRSGVPGGSFLLSVVAGGSDTVRASRGRGPLFFVRPYGSVSLVSDGSGVWHVAGADGVLAAPWTWAGCQLWLEADSGVTLNGSTVSAWADTRTGVGNSVAQGTAASQPTFTASAAGFKNRAALTFDGSNDSLSASSLTGMTAGNVPFTMGCCASRNDAASGSTFLSYGNTVNSNLHALGKNGGAAQWWFAGTGNSAPFLDWSDSARHAFVRQFAGAAGLSSTLANASDLFVDDERAPTTAASGRNSCAFTTPGTQLYAGSYAGQASTFLDGIVACVFAYSRRVTDEEALDIQRYLRAKY